MQKSNLLTVSLVVLGIVIGLGLYLNRQPSRPPAQPTDPAGITRQLTNHPPVQIQRTSAAVNTSEAPEQSRPSQPPREKVEEYLRRHNRNATSLLAAFRALNDTNYLYEAATNFPNDPRVQWTILARDAFPEDRRKWLDAFKSSSPSNSVANYLSAQDYFKNNQPEAAVKELLAAGNKTQFKDFSMDTVLDAESLARFSGSSASETPSAAMAALSGDLSVLGNFKGVATGIKDAQQQYISSGDSASAQALAQAGVGLADTLMKGDSGKLIIDQLVGIASENIVLAALDQNTSYDFLGGETPAQRLAELAKQRDDIKDLRQALNLLPTLNEDQLANYWERSKIYGEPEALRWVQQQNPATPNSGN